MLKAGVVAKYDIERRICQVSIPGITDGSRDLPEAEFCSSIGDKSEHTAIRIERGDRVWLMFEDDNPMKPVIMGFRPKNRENENEWRRWHHENVEIEADEVVNAEGSGSGLVHDPAGEILLTSNNKITLNAKTGYAGVSGDPMGEITVDSNYTINLNCVRLNIVATEFVKVETPKFYVDGKITSSKDIIADVPNFDSDNGISLIEHVHKKVTVGYGKTGLPE